MDFASSVTSSTEESVVSDEGAERLCHEIREGVVGAKLMIDTPFGSRRLMYCDYTASGQALEFVENFVCQQVLPNYANTHTEASYTGKYTSMLREQARESVARSCGASAEDVVVFAGSGTTAAVQKVVQLLRSVLFLTPPFKDSQRPVIFIGPYEHHSNILMWRESSAIVVEIPDTVDGSIDCAALESALQEYSAHKLKIGSFSAGSNVTGVLSDTIAISCLLHKYNALSFWDYAAAGPHVNIEMNPADHRSGEPIVGAHKDAVFLSPHKFVGGPQTPGVLIAKKHLFDQCSLRRPTVPGGGVVSMVTPTEQVYIQDEATREEAGTPAIVESIRCGMVFQLKDAVGHKYIEQREHDLLARAFSRWKDCENLWILGPNDIDKVPRLGIVSMRVKGLHYNYAVALLNDLFGIQARGGCSCAGPYGFRLLEFEPNLLDDIIRVVGQRGSVCVKPGWFRVSFQYFMSDAQADFLIEAVSFVAEHGWKFLPMYSLDVESSIWTHTAEGDAVTASDDVPDSVSPPARSFSDLVHELQSGGTGKLALGSDALIYNELDLFRSELADAKRELSKITQSVASGGYRDVEGRTDVCDKDISHLVDFLMPKDAVNAIASGAQNLAEARETAHVELLVGCREYCTANTEGIESIARSVAPNKKLGEHMKGFVSNEGGAETRVLHSSLTAKLARMISRQSSSGSGVHQHQQQLESRYGKSAKRLRFRDFNDKTDPSALPTPGRATKERPQLTSILTRLRTKAEGA